jgi:ATP-dependent DNA helicase RecG
MMVGLDDPLTALPGVGPVTATAFADEIDVRTVSDLISYWPRSHRDLGDLSAVEEAEVGTPVTLLGTIQSWSNRRVRNGKLRIDIAVVLSPGGGSFELTFFQAPWIAAKHPSGTYAAYAGKLEMFGGRLKLNTPVIEELPPGEEELLSGRLRPQYVATKALHSATIGKTIRVALDALGALDEWVDAVTLAREGMIGFDGAVREIHVPTDRELLAAAVRRLKLDELYTLALGLRWRRSVLERHVVGLDNGPVDGGLADRFIDALPFTATGAQSLALSEIAVDLAGTRPMHRLLQGDVGSGKTLVATWTMLNAVDHGRQAAMMVPTEVLAEQHLRTLLGQLEPFGVNMFDGPRVELLTGSTTVAEQRRILSGLMTGEVDLVVGTHALLEEHVRFADLGVVIIDEQHRFGVDQRVTIKDKRADLPGERTAVDMLVMTATPIPRSLSLTVYGDLDVTVLDELPPGRTPIVTQLITPTERDRRSKLESFVRERAAAGDQTYWVCPLVDPSDAVVATAATTQFEHLRDTVFPELRVGLVHGQMSSAMKEDAMDQFRRGELDVLVATTVIEVGVDVPNATVMVIEDAERFGISQLHQLRGRVGRGARRSFCVLFAGWSLDPDDWPDHATPLQPDQIARLAAVASTTDGFVLAQVDLETRGSGTLFGTAQSGVQDLKLASLKDEDLIVASRLAAELTIEADPDLAAHPSLRAQVRRRHRGLEQFAALETG